MNFNWDEFSEIDFADYCSMVENGMFGIGDYVGVIRVGKICFDLILRETYDGGMVLTYDAYVDTKGNGCPCDEIGGGDFPDTCISMTYEVFRNMAEEIINEFIISENLLDN